MMSQEKPVEISANYTISSPRKQTEVRGRSWLERQTNQPTLSVQITQYFGKSKAGPKTQKQEWQDLFQSKKSQKQKNKQQVSRCSKILNI